MTPYIEQVLKSFREKFSLIGIKSTHGEERGLLHWSSLAPEYGKALEDFLITSLTQQDEMVRREERERIIKELTEQAEPYDGSKWHNNLSLETIKKIINH